MSLSNLCDKTFTLINQLPKSQDCGQSVMWIKHTLNHCDKKSGLYDKSSNQTFYKDDVWTARIKDWKSYVAPGWLIGEYYALDEGEQQNCFTVNIGDLIIFADIPDKVPTNTAEFIALRDKYSINGGIITAVEVNIRFKPNGKPWRTNHIKVVRT